jgi:hypothetical protein
MLMSYGFGLAYRFSDKLTFSADFSRTEWPHFVLRDKKRTEIFPISGRAREDLNVGPAGVNTTDYGPSELIRHLTYFFLPVGLILLLTCWRRKT